MKKPTERMADVYAAHLARELSDSGLPPSIAGSLGLGLRGIELAFGYRGEPEQALGDLASADRFHGELLGDASLEFGHQLVIGGARGPV